MNNKNEYANELSAWLIFLLAFTCGGMVANLYYAQTIIASIGKDLHLNLRLAGFIVTITQVGYCLGLLFLVPLADIIENKCLILTLLGLLGLFLIELALTHSIVIFLICCLFIGITAVAIQIIIPFVAHFTPIDKRGLAVGNVTSGLLLGIMLARPVASFVTELFNWQTIFLFSALLMFFLVVCLFFLLPNRLPTQKISYRDLIASLPVILKTYSILQRRALYHASLFGVFSLFWTSIAMLLMGNYYHYSQAHVAIFAFVGAMGAFVAPIAGRIADHGYTRIATGVAILLVGMTCVLAKFNGGHSMTVLVISALLLDAGVACNLVLGQRSIYALSHEVRSRLNGLYMAIFFMGGATGSGLSGYLYAQGGWDYIADTGIIIVIVTFVYFLSEYFTNLTK